MLSLQFPLRFHLVPAHSQRLARLGGLCRALTLRRHAAITHRVPEFFLSAHQPSGRSTTSRRISPRNPLATGMRVGKPQFSRKKRKLKEVSVRHHTRPATLFLRRSSLPLSATSPPLRGRGDWTLNIKNDGGWKSGKIRTAAGILLGHAAHGRWIRKIHFILIVILKKAK